MPDQDALDSLFAKLPAAAKAAPAPSADALDDLLGKLRTAKPATPAAAPSAPQGNEPNATNAPSATEQPATQPPAQPLARQLGNTLSSFPPANSATPIQPAKPKNQGQADFEKESAAITALTGNTPVHEQQQSPSLWLPEFQAVKDALTTSPIPQITVKPEDHSTPVYVPQLGTVNLSTVKTIANVITGQVTPATALVMLGSAGAGEAIAALANSEKAAALLDQSPQLAKLVDMASRTAVSTGFAGYQGYQGTKAEIDAYDLKKQAADLRKQGKAQEAQQLDNKAEDAMIGGGVNLLLAGLSAAHAATGATQTAAAYPPEPSGNAPVNSPYGSQVLTAADIGSLKPAATSAEAAQAAEALESSGSRLAAQAWRRLDNTVPIPINVGNKTAYILPPQQTPSGRTYHAVVDANGKILVGGTADTVSAWFDQNKVSRPEFGPETPNPFAPEGSATSLTPITTSLRTPPAAEATTTSRAPSTTPTETGNPNSPEAAPPATTSPVSKPASANPSTSAANPQPSVQSTEVEPQVENGSQAEEQKPLVAGQSFDTPQGNYTVRKLVGDKVIVSVRLPDSPPDSGVSKVMQQDDFRKVVGLPAQSKTPLLPADQESAVEGVQGTGAQQPEASGAQEIIPPAVAPSHAESTPPGPPIGNTIAPIGNTKEPQPGHSVASFTTAQGSTYVVNGDSTTRTKSLHPGHDPNDVGEKDPSARTVYVDPKFATEVGMWNTLSSTQKRIALADGKVVLASVNPAVGMLGRDQIVGDNRFSTTPQVGLAPLELFQPDGLHHYRGNHPGNAITNIGPATAQSSPSNEEPKQEVAPASIPPPPAGFDQDAPPAAASEQIPSTTNEPEGETAGTEDRSKETQPTLHKFSSTQANTPELDEPIKAFRKNIPADQLAPKDGEDPLQAHITVRYGNPGTDPAPIQKALEGEPPIQATLGKASIFKTPNADVLKVSVDSPDLHRLNSKVGDAVEHTGETYPDYQPHVTIAYLKPGQGEQYVGRPIHGVTGKHIELPSVTFSGKDGKQVDIPLSGKRTAPLSPERQPAAPATSQGTGTEQVAPIPSTPAKTEGPIPKGTWMNDFDIDRALEKFKDHPVLSHATRFLHDFSEEANDHSDGWHSWPLPSHAASQLMGMIQHPEYASLDNYKKALGPIRSFLTKRGEALGMKMPETGLPTAKVPTKAPAKGEKPGAPTPKETSAPVNQAEGEAAATEDRSKENTPAKTYTPTIPKDLKWTEAADELFRKEYDDDPAEYFRAAALKQKHDFDFIKARPERLKAISGKKGAPQLRKEEARETQKAQDSYEVRYNEADMVLGTRAMEEMQADVENSAHSPATTPAPAPVQSPEKPAERDSGSQAQEPVPSTREPEPTSKPTVKLEDFVNFTAKDGSSQHGKVVALYKDGSFQVRVPVSNDTPAHSEFIKPEQLRRINGEDVAPGERQPAKVEAAKPQPDYAALESKLNQSEAEVRSTRREYDRLQNLYRISTMKAKPTPEEKDELDDDRQFGAIVKPQEQEEAITKALILAARRFDAARIAHDKVQEELENEHPLLTRQPADTIAKAESPKSAEADATLKQSTEMVSDAVSEAKFSEKLGEFDTVQFLVPDIKRELKDLEEDIRELEHASPDVMMTAVAVRDEARKLIERASAPGYVPEPVPEPEDQSPVAGGSVLIPEADRLIGAFRKIVRSILDHVGDADAIKDNTTLMKRVQEVTGRSVADGSLDTKQVYDLLETAVNQEIARGSEFESMMHQTASVPHALGNLRYLLSHLPTQAIRSEEQTKFQQFSTPPTEAFVAARALAPTKDDVVLEPSAGTGGLAAFAKAAGARVMANEIAPRRNELLQRSGYRDVAKTDGEQINNVYPDVFGEDAPNPTAVLMNPPFSAAGDRGVGNSNDIGYRHVLQALARLEPGGRLVAILGGGNANPAAHSGDGASLTAPSAQDFWRKVRNVATVRANVRIAGKEYAKYGTSFATRIVVIDKIPNQTRAPEAPVTGDFDTLEEAWNALAPIAQDRQPVPKVGTNPPRGGQLTSGPSQPGAVRQPGGEPGTAVRGGSGGNRPTHGSGQTGSSPQRPQSNESDIQPQGPTAPDRPIGGGEPARLEAEQNDPAPLNAPQTIEQAVHAGEDIGDYVAYKASNLPKEWGARPHNAIIVETQTMASVPEPPVTMKPNIPQSIIDKGELSDVQLATIAHTIQAHERFSQDGKRLGFFNGDGTGVGKGRMNAGTAVHYWNTLPEGKRKTIWISFNEELAEAARDDLDNVGGKEIPIYSLEKVGPGKELPFKEGVLFVPYSKIAAQQVTKADGSKFEKGASKADRASGQKVMRRLQQILDWAGDEPLIVFDEAHKAKNATATQENISDKRKATKKPTLTGLAAIELQNKTPKARVLYSSATGFSDVSNMAYANRLDAWGPGTAFKDFQDFRQQIDAGGIGIMEMVARDLKAQGKYLSRFISYAGVSFDETVHDITPEQHKMLDRAGEAWRTVIDRFGQAADETTANATDPQASSSVRSAAMSQLWGAELRFYRSLYTAMKVPTLIDIIDKALTESPEHPEGKSVVISVLETGQAQQDREIERLAKEGEDDLEGADVSPVASLIDMVDKRFPTIEYETVKDENGQEVTKVRMVTGKDGIERPAQNAEALAAKAALLADLEKLRGEFPDSALDQIINRYGSANVAEMTKRAERLVRNPETGRRELESRGSDLTKTNLHEMAAFQNGDKKIALISNAASTGISLHSSVRAKNQRQRVHVMLQLKWSADMVMQDLGRTHRTAQRIPPQYILLSLNVDAEKRFAATVARRLEQLGALSRGERKAGGGATDFSKYNFESKYGRFAVDQLIDRLYFGNDRFGFLNENRMKEWPELQDGRQVLELMGLYDPDREADKSKEGSPDVPVNRFFNRLMILPIKTANEVFRAFMATMDHNISSAQRMGIFDRGAELIHATHLNPEGTPLVVYQDPTTKAQAVYYKLQSQNPRNRVPAEAMLRKLSDGYRLYRVKSTGRLVAIEGGTGWARTDEKSGRTYRVLNGFGASGSNAQMTDQEIAQATSENPAEREASKFEPVYHAWEAQPDWNRQYEQAGPWITSTEHLITGSVLPIWSKIQEREGSGKNATSKPIKVKIGKLDDGRRLIGADIQPSRIREVLKSLGHAPTANPEQVMQSVLGGKKFGLMQGATLKRSKVSGMNRLELEGATHFQRLFPSWGLYAETLSGSSMPRWFIPTGERGIGVLTRVLKELPLRGEDEEATTQPEDETNSLGGQNSERGVGNMLLFGQRNPQEPRSTYSGLTSLKRTLLPGSNLAEVEGASKPVFEAALPAAGASSIASNVLQAAVPAIRKALQGTGYTWPEMQLFYIEGRLQGVKQRWQGLADQARTLKPDQLEDAIAPTPDGEPSPLLSLLSHIEGRAGIDRDLGQTAAALAEAKDWETLGPFLEMSFQDAADRVASVMPSAEFSQMLDATKTNPGVKEADQLYGDLVEKPMAEAHAVNEGVFSTALGPAGRYYPLIPTTKDIAQPPGRRIAFHKPRNMANQFATGLSKNYDASMESLGKKLAAGIRGNYKAALIQQMTDSRWIVPESKAHRIEGHGLVMRGPDGQLYDAARVEVGQARTVIENGRVSHRPARFAVTPTFMERGLRATLEREPMDPDQVIGAMRWANMLATKGPLELLYHSAGVLGSLYGNTPFLGHSGLDKALSAPVLKWLTLRAKLAMVDPTSPENVAKLHEMALAGAVPAKSGKVTYSTQHAADTGATRERLSFAPLLYGPKGIDARARILMYDIWRAAYPNGTRSDLHHFVNQLANYTPEMQGRIEQGLKNLGIGPFATAGMTRIVNAVENWTGTGPGPGKTLESRAMWWLTSSAIGALAIWAIAHKYLTGKLPGDDMRSQLNKIPVGQGNGYIDQFRHSKIGNALWGTGPQVGYLDFGVYNDPLMERGARAMGFADAYRAHQLGATKGQMLDAWETGTLNALAHPALGPAARAIFVGLTGAEPYLTGLHDRGQAAPRLYPAVPPHTPPGALLPRAVAAAKQLNSFYAEGAENLGDLTGFTNPRPDPKSGDWLTKEALTINPFTTGLVGAASNPFARREQLRQDARLSRIPHYAKGGIIDHDQTAEVGEAGPEAVVDLKAHPQSARSDEDLVRGSADIPLSAEGLAQAEEIARRFAAKGGVDKIYSSGLTRAMQTAAPVSRATGAPIVYSGPDFYPWHMGGLEGKPSKQAEGQIALYATKKPNVPIPGRGSESSHDGESFNSFKRRGLNALKPLLAELKQKPDEKLLIVTHLRFVKLAESWVKKGAPPSLEIDSKHMASTSGSPGTLSRLFWQDGKVQMEPINMKSNAQLKGGIYLERHGLTPWNAQSAVKVIDKPTVMELKKGQAVVPLKA